MCNYCCNVGIKDCAPTELLHCDLDGNINEISIYLGYVSIWIDDDGKLCSAYETDNDCARKYEIEEINYCPKCGEDLRVIKKLRNNGTDLQFCFQEDLNGQNVCNAIWKGETE